jgi:DNA invertase Pin-like site-specific DNA recombinase
MPTARAGRSLRSTSTRTTGSPGAEFIKRPAFLRLMNSLKPRPPFNVLIMSEETRLGREAIETAYALKQIVTAGVRVFFYLENRERTLDSPTDKIMLSLATFADEMHRVQNSQMATDAMLRKARAGHVTGGKVYGYDNMDVLSSELRPDGRPKRLHVVRQVNPEQAEVVRRIFTLSAAGMGITRIAKTLNADGVKPARKAQGWAPTAIREILYRPLYRAKSCPLRGPNRIYGSDARLSSDSRFGCSAAMAGVSVKTGAVAEHRFDSPKRDSNPCLSRVALSPAFSGAWALFSTREKRRFLNAQAGSAHEPPDSPRRNRRAT